MNMIVLAAGKGNRMGVLTKDKPKPLLNLGGETLLERQLRSIRDSGVIDKIIYIIGYKGEAIEKRLQRIKADDVLTIFNPFFDISNNLISLWFAKHYMDTDFVITNGDNLFDSTILRNLSFNRGGIYLAVNKKSAYDNDDMKVTLKDGQITNVSKLIFEGDADCESVGLAVISGKRSRELFKETLERLARSADYTNAFWLEVFNVIVTSKVMITPFYIQGEWKEFDYHTDISNYLSDGLKNYRGPATPK